MNHTHMPDSSTLKGTLYARLSKETQVIFSMMSAQRFNAGNGPLSHGLINKRKDPGGQRWIRITPPPEDWRTTSSFKELPGADCWLGHHSC